MEQLLNNIPIDWVQVTDPSTGRVYFAPSSYIYPFNSEGVPVNIEGVNVSGSEGFADTGSLLTTASFSDPRLLFTKGNGDTFFVDLSSLTVTNALTASYIDGGEF